MTFGQFKNLLKGNTFGELSIPADDGVLKELLMSTIISEIATEVTPTVLLEQDREKAEMLYPFPLTDKFFIRKPVLVVDDSSEIDLDEVLCHAAVLFVATRFVRDEQMVNKKAELRSAAKKILQNYMWNFYYYIQSKGICDDLSR